MIRALTAFSVVVVCNDIPAIFAAFDGLALLRTIIPGKTGATSRGG